MNNVHRSRVRWAGVTVLAGALIATFGATAATAQPVAATKPAAHKASGARPDPSFGPTQRAAAVRAAQSASGRLVRQLRMGGQQLIARDAARDINGSQHLRYERTYAGLPVVGGDFLVHRSSRGALTGVDYGSTPRSIVLRGRALVATASSATAPGKGARKVIYADQHAPVLAWRTRVTGTAKDGTPIDEWVFTDAHTGKRLGTRTMIYTDGTGTGLLNGTVPLKTKVTTIKGKKAWQLIDQSRGNHATYDANNKFLGDLAKGTLFTDSNNVWGGTSNTRQRAAVDAAYGAANTWDYYKNTYGRIGIDGDGKGSYSRVHFGQQYDNAFWSDTCFCMTYGDGDGQTTRPLVALDVAGHEMTHGVTANSSGLDYFGDAGGLNESSSDVMGTMVEFYANNPNDPGDYLIGEKIIKNTTPMWLRRMDDPAADGLSLNCWKTNAGTYDPHFSSGIGNHAFYLMAEGSTPKTIHGVSYNSPICAGGPASVTGIGRDNAAAIWYRAMTTYWVSTSTYAEAADGMLKAAKDLFPSDQSKCDGVEAAWHAVNVTTTEDCTTPTGTDPSGNLVSDPSFEEMQGAWTETQNPDPDPSDPPKLIYTTSDTGIPAHTGEAFAYLGDEYDASTGLPIASDDTISQQVTIPAGGESTVAFYLQAYSYEDPHTGPVDYFTVEINGTPVKTYSNVDANDYSDGTWLLRKVSVPASYSGQTVTLSFHSTNDDNLNGTGWLIDDVNMQHN